MSAGSNRVVVVGGGVIGAACAYYLRQEGRSVTLIEQGEFGRGCSHGNCGYVCPSHALPIAGPGALWRTLKTLLARNSPVQVRWRLDPAMWRWFWQFARKCNQQDMIQNGHAIHALLKSSRLLYDELVSSTLKDVEWEALGVLFVFRSQSELDHYAHVDQLLRKEFNLGATRYDQATLLEMEPSLKPVSVGAWHYRTDAHLRPDKLMRAWRSALKTQGVEIREQCELRDFLTERRTVKGLLTSQGQLSADQVVVATGAWTPQLCRLLRTPIAIQPGKGYSITMPRPARCPRYPLVFEEDRVAISPYASGYRIGSTMEFAGYDTRLNPDRLRLLRDTASLYLHEPLAEPVLESWYGWRPMTPDGLPFLGPVPAFDNVYLAAGHGMLGVSMSPATGRLLSELVCGKTPHLDPQPYAVGR
jgi:D-amino-acid dehydrogenase